MSGHRKGSNFEREICKQLSLWWTYGDRDDVFWRSSQSGGRATIRSRAGKTTAGSYGDICALDPIGEPFLKLFTVELKRGRSHGDPGDLIDCKGSADCHPFIAALCQAREAHVAAGSRSWLLIVKRDFRHPAIYFPSWLISKREQWTPLFEAKRELIKAPIFRYRCHGYDFAGISLEKFLRCVDPATLAGKMT